MVSYTEVYIDLNCVAISKITLEPCSGQLFQAEKVTDNGKLM